MPTRTAASLLVLVLPLRLATSTPAVAQTPPPGAIRIDHRTYPGPDNLDRVSPGDPVSDRPGWTWAHDGYGWLQLPPATFVPSLAACTALNPYAYPAEANACATWRRATYGPAHPYTYQIAATYSDPYNRERMIVLALGTSVEGVPVVLAQYLSGGRYAPGAMWAFLVTEGVPWRPIN
jgi:hypothetical protein